VFFSMLLECMYNKEVMIMKKARENDFSEGKVLIKFRLRTGVSLCSCTI